MFNKNSIWGFIGFLVPTISVLIFYRVLISNLGAIDFGLYSLAAAVGGIALFLDLGLAVSIVRFISIDIASGKKGDAQDVIKTSLVFYGFIGALFSVVLFLVIPHTINFFKIPDGYEPIAINAFRLFSIQFSILLLSSVYLSLLKSINKFKLVTLIGALNTITSFLFSSILVSFNLIKLEGVIICGLVGGFLQLIAAILISNYELKLYNIRIFSGDINKKTIRRMLGFSSVLTLHMLASVFFNQAQKIIIGLEFGPSSVATYQVAYTLVSRVHAVINSIVEYIYPLVSAGINDLNKLYLKNIKIVFFLTIFIILPMIIFSYLILSMWVGAIEADKGSPLILPLGVAFIFISLSAPTYHILNGIGRPMINVIYSVSNVMIFIICLLIFSINSLTLYDFCISFMISNVITGLSYQIYVYKFLINKDFKK